jgi:hypothetical protein
MKKLTALRGVLFLALVMTLVLGTGFSTHLSAKDGCGCPQGQSDQKQEKGWCCLNGKVIAAEKVDCEKKGGNWFLKKEDAEKYCKLHPVGWCCLKGKVIKATKADCEKQRGKFFEKKVDADKYCRQHQPMGWCCFVDVIKKARKDECLAEGGEWFAKKEDAEKHCSQVKK